MICSHPLHSEKKEINFNYFRLSDMLKILLLALLLPTLIYAQDKPEPRIQEGQFTFDTDRPFSVLELDQKIEEPKNC